MLRSSPTQTIPIPSPHRKRNEVAEYRSRLWKRKAGGDEEARDLLISEYWPMVRVTLRRIIPNIPRNIDEDDLISEGTIGLARGIDRFDLERNVKPESFLIGMVRGALLEYLRKEDWAKRSLRRKQNLLRTAEAALTHLLNREPTDEERAAHLELDMEAFESLRAAATPWQVLSFEQVVIHTEDDDPDDLLMCDQIRSQEPDPADIAIEALETEALWQFVEWLPLPERRVVHDHYILGKLQKQIAIDMGRSESRVHQLHAQAMRRLKRFMTGTPPQKVQGDKLPHRTARGLLVRAILAEEPLPLTRERREAIAEETACHPNSVQRISKLVEAGRPQSAERWAA